MTQTSKQLNILIASISVLLIYAAWARGGTVQSLQLPLPIIAGVLLIALAVKRGGLKRLLRDPVTWTGLLFLGLLAIQWWNAGRVHFFDPFLGEWDYTAPRIAWLPAAFSRDEAAEMLRWFFPAWALLAAIRAGDLGAHGARRLLQVLAVNGAALAVFGIVQQLSGTEAIFWIDPLDGTRFFASFGYENHAGAYFVLTMAISMGLLLREFFGRKRGPRPRVATGWAVVLLLNFAAANLSFSRAGIALSWTAALAALGATIHYARQHWHLSHQVNAALAAIALAVVAGVFALRIGGSLLMDEVSDIEGLRGKEGDDLAIVAAFDSRIAYANAAIGVWQEHPYFGCGGWGFRYLLPYELPDDDWEWVVGSFGNYGKANVHNDFLQFLAEFGLVGFGLMLATVGFLIAPVVRRKDVGPLTSMALVGVLLVAVHSLIDLPFRSPGVLYAWLAVLACAPLLAEVRGQRAEVRGQRSGAEVRGRGAEVRGQKSEVRGQSLGCKIGIR